MLDGAGWNCKCDLEHMKQKKCTGKITWTTPRQTGEKEYIAAKAKQHQRFTENQMNRLWKLYSIQYYNNIVVFVFFSFRFFFVLPHKNVWSMCEHNHTIGYNLTAMNYEHFARNVIVKEDKKKKQPKRKTSTLQRVII